MTLIPQSKLVAELAPNFRNAGFRFFKSQSEFRKLLDSGDVLAIGIDLMRASKSGYFKAASSAHIRIEAIEAVYAKHHPLLTQRELKNHYTISVNCDNLYRDQSVSRSVELLSDAAIVAYSKRLWQSIESDVLPFLEKYGSYDELIRNLQSEDYKSWVTSDRMVQYSVLLSDRAIASDKAGFERYADELLEYCKKDYGQMYRSAAEPMIQGVRAQFFSVQK
jgi:hypothetical protein